MTNHKQASDAYQKAADLRQNEIAEYWHIIEEDEHDIWPVEPEFRDRHDFIKFAIVVVVFASAITAGLYFGDMIDIQFLGD